jgi:hypothetical protein
VDESLFVPPATYHLFWFTRLGNLPTIQALLLLRFLPSRLLNARGMTPGAAFAADCMRIFKEGLINSLSPLSSFSALGYFNYFIRLSFT